MADIIVNAKNREKGSKSLRRQLRREGQLPSVLYKKGENRLISVPVLEIEHVMRHHNIGSALVTLQIGEEKIPTLVKEVQRDPVLWFPQHIDFYWVDMSHSIETSVSVHLEGNAAGVKEGGILEHMLREVHIRCNPANIPTEIVYNIDKMEIHDVVHVSDLAIPEGVEITTDGSQVVAMVGEASTQPVEEPTEEEAAATAAAAEEGGEEAAAE